MRIDLRTMDLGQIARAALPAWGLYMKNVYNDGTLEQYKKAAFIRPANFTLNCEENFKDSLDTYTAPSSSGGEGVMF